MAQDSGIDALGRFLRIEKLGCDDCANEALDDFLDEGALQNQPLLVQRYNLDGQDLRVADVLAGYLRNRLKDPIQYYSFIGYLEQTYKNVPSELYFDIAVILTQNRENETALSFAKKAYELTKDQLRRNDFARFIRKYQDAIYEDQPELGWAVDSEFCKMIPEDDDVRNVILADDSHRLYFLKNQRLACIDSLRDGGSGVVMVDGIDTTVYREIRLACAWGRYLGFSSKINGHWDLFVGQIEDSVLHGIRPLGRPINSEFDEKGFCYDPISQRITFASNRPNGKGGYDLYTASGSLVKGWSNVENVQSANTEWNEMFPQLTTDATGLFFCSDRAESFESFDIYHIDLKTGLLDHPNFPINSSLDEFTASGTTKSLYIDCPAEVKDKSRVIHLENLKGVPYTLLRGIVIEEQNGNKKYKKLRVSVVDTEQNKAVKSVYLPINKPGYYYAIVQPGHTYNIVYQIDGYVPVVISVEVPLQSNFYSIFQDVSISHKSGVLGNEGQLFTISNTFYDISKLNTNANSHDTRDTSFSAIQQIVNSLVETEDELTQRRLEPGLCFNMEQGEVLKNRDYSVLLTMLETAIVKQDTNLLLNLRNEAFSSENCQQELAYAGDKKAANLTFYQIGTEEVIGGPVLFTAKNRTSRTCENNVLYAKKRLLKHAELDLEAYNLSQYKASVHDLLILNFSDNLTVIPPRIQELLLGVVRKLNKRDLLVIQVARQENEKERSFQNLRSVTTREFLLSHGVSPKQIVICTREISEKNQLLIRNFGFGVQPQLDMLVLKTEE